MLINCPTIAQNSSVSDSTKFKNTLELVRKYEGEPSKSLELCEELIILAEKLADKRKMAITYDELHLIHRRLGNLTEANEFYLKALKIFEEIGLKEDIAASYAQEASLLMLEGQYQQSVNEYLKSLEIYLQLKDTFMTNVIRVNLGETYRLYEQYDSASIHLKQALRENFQEDEIIGGYGDGNLGMVYFALDQFDSAKSLLETSIALLNHWEMSIRWLSMSLN